MLKVEIEEVKDSSSVQHIIIIGGGIIGVCAAYYLAKAVNESRSNPAMVITILEANEIAGGASGKAGGFLAKDWHSRSTSSLGSLSFDLHANLARELNGREIYGYRRVKCFGGSIDLDKADVFEWSSKNSDGDGDDSRAEHIVDVPAPPAQPTRTHPLPPDTSPSIIDPDTPTWLRNPQNFQTVSDEETTAQVHPYQFTQAIYQECLKLGVKFLRGRPLSWNRDGSVLSVLPAGEESNGSSSGLSIPATTLIITAGPWSERVANQLIGINLPISYLPGHSLILQAPSSSSVHTQAHSAFLEFKIRKQKVSNSVTRTPEVFLRPDGSIYVAGENTGPPLPDGTKEVDGIIDPGAIEKLRRSVQFAGIEGKEIREQLCYRPLTQRGVPMIGKLGDGIYIATGHGPWGITLAPGTGKVVSELVLGRPLSANITNLEPKMHGVEFQG